MSLKEDAIIKLVVASMCDFVTHFHRFQSSDWQKEYFADLTKVDLPEQMLHLWANSNLQKCMVILFGMEKTCDYTRIAIELACKAITVTTVTVSEPENQKTH